MSSRWAFVSKNSACWTICAGDLISWPQLHWDSLEGLSCVMLPIHWLLYCLAVENYRCRTSYLFHLCPNVTGVSWLIWGVWLVTKATRLFATVIAPGSCTFKGWTSADPCSSSRFPSQTISASKLSISTACNCLFHKWSTKVIFVFHLIGSIATSWCASLSQIILGRFSPRLWVWWSPHCRILWFYWSASRKSHKFSSGISLQST